MILIYCYGNKNQEAISEMLDITIPEAPEKLNSDSNDITGL